MYFVELQTEEGTFPVLSNIIFNQFLWVLFNLIIKNVLLRKRF